MTTTRRELLGAGASAALGLLPWGNTAPVLAQASPARETAGAQTWEDGDLAHVLPTSSHDRILIKTSFKKPLDATPILQVGENRISGLRSDTRGLFWQFHAGDLKPGTSYELSLTSSDGRATLPRGQIRSRPREASRTRRPGDRSWRANRRSLLRSRRPRLRDRSVPTFDRSVLRPRRELR